MHLDSGAAWSLSEVDAERKVALKHPNKARKRAIAEGIMRKHKDDGEQREKHEVYDVVVVGGGGSGLAAAVRAAELGLQALLLEKDDRLGGSTARSIGSISAAGTVYQKRAKIEDSPDWHFEDMPKFAPNREHLDNRYLRRTLVDNCADTVHWLTGHGVRFLGPMPEPPHRVPRMLNVLPNSKAYIHYLKKSANRLGVHIKTSSPIVDLVTENGHVTGVRYKSEEGSSKIAMAERGVILAAGDFSGSRELKREHLGAETVGVQAISPGNTGDGIRMGLRLGSRILNGQFASGPQLRFVEKQKGLFLERLPPSKVLAFAMRMAWKLLPQFLLRPFIMSFATTNLAPRPEMFADGALLITEHGESIDGSKGNASVLVSETGSESAFIIFDDELATAYDVEPNYVSTAPGLAYAYVSDYRRNRSDIYYRADTLTELATQIGLSPDAVRDAYVLRNGHEENNSRGPFHALGPARAWVIITDGGLEIDSQFHVVAHNMEPVSGLYAVGSNGQGGVVLEGHGHHLAWAFTSGKLCAEQIAGTRPS